MRKLHNYLGLWLLLWIWLFAFSGIVLNHPTWRAAQFWAERAETTTVRAVRPPAASSRIGDAELAAALMRELGITGEVQETKRSGDGARFDVQVVRPGRVWRLEARLDSAVVRVTEIRLDARGVVDALHKLTGVRMRDPALRRDWVMTRLWSLSMDAVAIGLIVLVASGLWLWWRRTPVRVPGLVALALGTACGVFFLFGLGALFA